MKVTSSQVVAVIKSIGAIVGAYVIGKGWIPGDVFNDFLAGVVLLVTGGMSWRENSTEAVINAAALKPEVLKMVVAIPEQAEENKTLKANPKVEQTPAKFYMG
jgi:hypothetical protein